MTEKAKLFVNKKVQEAMDEIHDVYCTLHDEMDIQILPADYVKYMRPMLIAELDKLVQDLHDEFDD